LELIITRKPKYFSFYEKGVFRLVGEFEIDSKEYLIFYSKQKTSDEDKIKFLPEVIKVIEVEL
jgi:hypothetical protein